MDLITVARFSNYFGMYVVKGRLEAEGIECYAANEHVITMSPMNDIAFGHIRLQVAETDVAAAQEILRDTHISNTGSVTGFNVIERVRQETSPLRIVLLILLAIMLILFI